VARDRGLVAEGGERPGRAVRALASVSSVVKVFEATMKSVSAGSRSWVASQMSVPSTFETNRNLRPRSEKS